jgi:single-strand DNA-binding protein
MNLNRVMLAGNLTRDPVVRFLANEQAVANFGLAINRRFKATNGELKEDVTFIDCEAWGKTAELIGQHLTKGRNVYVEGRLKLDTWEKDGQKHYKLKVVIDSLQFIGAKPQGGDAPAPAPASTPTATNAPGNDEPPF